MTVAFISTSDKTVTRYAYFDTETREQEKEIENYYLEEVKNGNIYGFTIG